MSEDDDDYWDDRERNHREMQENPKKRDFLFRMRGKKTSSGRGGLFRTPSWPKSMGDADALPDAEDR